MSFSFVFISYAHADSKTVLPIVDYMRGKGINVWYDNGIEAGSEWPEYIAEKVIECSRFVSFISKAYLDSQNCKRELNFAVSRRKELLSIYIEEVDLTPGIEMQLGTYQSIFLNRFSSFELFLSALCKERFFALCIESDVDECSVTNRKSMSIVEKMHNQTDSKRFEFYQIIKCASCNEIVYFDDQEIEELVCPVCESRFDNIRFEITKCPYCDEIYHIDDSLKYEKLLCPICMKYICDGQHRKEKSNSCMDNTEYHTVICPHCNDDIYFDDFFEPEELVCPACGKAVGDMD